VPAPVLRPRSAGEILDLSFQLFRAHFPRFLAAPVVFVLPLMVLRLLVPAEGAPLLEFLSNLMYTAAFAAVVVMVSEAYLGRDPGVRSAIGMVGQRFLSVWGASIIQGVVIVCGFILLVVPGFIFGAWTFAMVTVVMLENRRAGESFTRSRELARGNVPRIIGTMVVAVIVFFLCAVGAGFVTELVLAALPGAGVGSLLLAEALVFAAYTFVPTVATVLYYDARIRNEAFDVEVATATLQMPAPQPTPAAG
jgi:hypothetical protein